MSEASRKEWLLNEMATDVDKEVGLSKAHFNWLQERLKKLASDLEHNEIESAIKMQKHHQV